LELPKEGHKEEKIMKYIPIYTLFLMLVFCTYCKGQNKTNLTKDTTRSEIKDIISSRGPKSISRTIKQDRNGNIWIAAFDGVFRYDGKSFFNVTNKISSARFFSVLEDRNGNLWFGSIGSGVYYYDGKFFRNYMMNGDSMVEDRTGKTFPDFTRPPNEVTCIIEDKTRKFWFGTRGHTFVYDGKVFTVLTHDGKPFTNVRTIIEDKKGNIWLGGSDGLWRYNGSTFTNVTENFVGCIYEDNNGNIWTSSTRAIGERWALSRYDEKSLNNEKPTVTEIQSNYEDNRGMIFGILEAYDGIIWFGALDGVYCYDGNTITDFKGKEVQK
jgi:ligand-binding sensor domain-containing protein